MDLFWGNVPDGAPKAGNPALAAMRRPRKPSPAAPDTDTLMRDAIRQKIQHVNAIMNAQGLVSMQNLGRLGISADPERLAKQGPAHGIIPSDLTPEEKQWMVMKAYAAGMRERGE